jgi:anti-sigma factor RsiW
MNCIKTELIQKYIDQAASRKEINWVRKHLEVCPECNTRLTEIQLRSDRINKVINLLVDENLAVPQFIAPSKPLRIRQETQRKRLILSLSAACILICIVTSIFFHWRTQLQQEILIVQPIDREINANQTVTQQQLGIIVIEKDGKITQYPLR